MKIAVPIYSIKISPVEMDQAKKVRKALSDVMSSFDSISDSLEKFNSIIGEISKPEQISQLRKELLAFKHKIQEDFNALLDLVDVALTEWNEMISDSNFDSMRKAFIEEIRKAREHALEFLEKLRFPAEPKFLAEAPNDIVAISACKKSLEDIISAQMFQKIDKDILGRIRIGSRGK